MASLNGKIHFTELKQNPRAKNRPRQNLLKQLNGPQYVIKMFGNQVLLRLLVLCAKTSGYNKIRPNIINIWCCNAVELSKTHTSLCSAAKQQLATGDKLPQVTNCHKWQNAISDKLPQVTNCHKWQIATSGKFPQATTCHKWQLAIRIKRRQLATIRWKP